MNKDYGEVVDAKNFNDGESSKIFFRQMFISSGVWMLFFLTGLGFGAPTVLIPQMRKEANSTDVISEEMASWLSSISGYCAIPWVIIFCFVTQYIGRKIPIALVTLNTTSFFIVMYFSKTPIHILISGVMQGMNHASNMTLAVIVVSEYTSPRNRGIFLAIKSASLFWGIWVSNAIGTFLHWKCIPLVGIILSFYTFSVLYWPESPHWLATRGRFDECITAFHWLKGFGQKSATELENLIKTQKQYRAIKEKSSVFNDLKRYTTKAFYKPALLSIVMMLQYHLSGKVVCVVYAIDIIKKITNSETTAYIGMLILDGVTVTGMYLGCFISRFVKRRSMLLYTASVGVTFLFIIPLYLYLVKLSVLTENKVVTISLLTVFSVSISCGPMILSTSIYGELTPLRFKSSSTCITALTFVSLTSTLLKVSPYLFRVLNMHGTFLFYGLSSSVCALILYKYLPETKDKTLQEIEEGFSGIKPGNEEGSVLLSLQKKHKIQKN